MIILAVLWISFPKRKGQLQSDLSSSGIIRKLGTVGKGIILSINQCFVYMSHLIHCSSLSGRTQAEMKGPWKGQSGWIWGKGPSTEKIKFSILERAGKELTCLKVWYNEWEAASQSSRPFLIREEHSTGN